MAIMIIMGGLKDVNEIWHGQLYYDFQKEELSWANLIARISAKAKQDARKDLNLFRGVSTKPSPNKNDDTSFLNGYPKIWPRFKLIPKVYKKPGSISIFCAVCDFWHQADRPWCGKCDKHHHSNQCPKNQNTEANAPRGNQRNNKQTRKNRDLLTTDSNNKNPGSASPDAFNANIMSIIDSNKLASLA
jgi:hypothetical protein